MPRDETGKTELLTEPCLRRIIAAIDRPSGFAYQLMGEPLERYRARAIAYALTYDDEELFGMGLRPLEPTQEFTPLCSECGKPLDGHSPGGDCPVAEHWRMPSLAAHGEVSYHNRSPWAAWTILDWTVAVLVALVLVVAIATLLKAT
jgi:hypothetical protein